MILPFRHSIKKLLGTERGDDVSTPPAPFFCLKRKKVARKIPDHLASIIRQQRDTFLPSILMLLILWSIWI